MVEEIYDIKNQFLEKMRNDIEERGIDRVDVGEMYKLADIVKDMAEAEKSCWEAEYYRGVAEAMENQSGYPGGSGGSNYGGGMGYPQGGSSGRSGGSGGRSGGSGGRSGGSGYPSRGGRRGSRRGYAMGYPIEDLRMELQNADPQQREQMMNELRQLIGNQGMGQM